MEKLVEFGINESSTTERLNSAHEKMDLVNGTGEYLGMIQLGDHEILITKAKYLSNQPDKIMANEIEYDTYSDASIAVYYNLKKSEELLRLQEKLNHPLINKLLSQGKNIKEALESVGIFVHKHTTNMEERINAEFRPSERYEYPPNYDFNKAEQIGYTSQDTNIKKVPIEHIIVTGIQPELFENLKQAKRFTQMSTYQMAAFLKKLEEDKHKEK